MIISTSGTYYKAMSCGEIATFYDNSTLFEETYPPCKDMNAYAAVKADMNAEYADGIASALEMSFDTAIWVAFVIHAIGIEIYVWPYTALITNDQFINVSLVTPHPG